MPESKHVVLIVEDEEDVRASYDVTLSDEYDLLMAETGKEALEVLHRKKHIELVSYQHNIVGLQCCFFS